MTTKLKLDPVEIRALLEADRAQKLLEEVRARIQLEIDQLRSQVFSKEKDLRLMIEEANKSYQETLACIILNAGIQAPWKAKIVYSNASPIEIDISHESETTSALASAAEQS